MGALSREAILGAQDTPTETVAVPEWGGEVHVRRLTAEERDALMAQTLDETGKPKELPTSHFEALIVSLTAADESGKALFTADDIPALRKKCAAALDRVFTVGQRLNGLGVAAAEQAAKN